MTTVQLQHGRGARTGQLNTAQHSSTAQHSTGSAVQHGKCIQWRSTARTAQ